MAQANSLRSVLYALTANLSIAIAKFAAALYTGSGAMLAEAIHSVADSGNQLLLILGLKQSRRPPTEEYPLGYGKSIFFWSFVVAVMLFSMGGMFSFYEGWHKLHNPEPLHQPLVAIGVLVFAIVAEGLSLLGAMREINKIRGEMGWFEWFRESRESALLVIFGEDLAALLGLVIALTFILLTMLTGNPLFDALGSMAIGLLLVVVAWQIGKEVMALLIGQSASRETRHAMQAWLVERPEIAELYNLLTLQMGNDLMVAIKARMEEQQDATRLIEDINRVEKAFRKAFPGIAWCFFEPDTDD